MIKHSYSVGYMNSMWSILTTYRPVWIAVAHCLSSNMFDLHFDLRALYSAWLHTSRKYLWVRKCHNLCLFVADQSSLVVQEIERLQSLCTSQKRMKMTAMFGICDVMWSSKISRNWKYWLKDRAKQSKNVSSCCFWHTLNAHMFGTNWPIPILGLLQIVAVKMTDFRLILLDHTTYFNISKMWCQCATTCKCSSYTYKIKWKTAHNFHA